MTILMHKLGLQTYFPKFLLILLNNQLRAQVDSNIELLADHKIGILMAQLQMT